MLIWRYFLFGPLSLALPLYLVMQGGETPGGLAGMAVQLLAVVIYCCLSVFLLVSFKPATMRRRLEATPNRIDDLHLWLAPLLVIAAFLWGGFWVVGILAFAGVAERMPMVFFAVLVGVMALAVWMGVMVRRAFTRRE
ncbi:MAG: hypothetical protein GY952_02215 [Rhodobacteraceae bacterium]|nr:hypothetical protein [Paracoccaceae bacterium]